MDGYFRANRDWLIMYIINNEAVIQMRLKAFSPNMNPTEHERAILRSPVVVYQPPPK